jgi:putative FmdB family regulatory protein
MPTYDYECQACKHKFEKFQSIKAKPVRKCPKCGKLKAKRLLGIGAGVIFKGSGFYSTDYRSDSYKKRAGQDKPAGDAKSSGSCPASDSSKPQCQSCPNAKKD